jgi:hypothetical protein
MGSRFGAYSQDGFAERLLADGLRSPADALAQQIGTGIELIGKRKDGAESRSCSVRWKAPKEVWVFRHIGDRIMTTRHWQISCSY